MNCDRVSHWGRSDQTQEGDEMSVLQTTVQHAANKSNVDHQAHESHSKEAKHETDEEGAWDDDDGDGDGDDAARVSTIEKEEDTALQDSSGNNTNTPNTPDTPDTPNTHHIPD